MPLGALLGCNHFAKDLIPDASIAHLPSSHGRSALDAQPASYG